MLYHNYIFLKAQPTLRSISSAALQKHGKEWVNRLNSSTRVRTATYATVGLKANTSVLLWMQSDTLEETQDLINDLTHSALGRHLENTFTLFGMTRPTQYVPQKKASKDTSAQGKKYLVIYPFNKTPRWYMLDDRTRRGMMSEHIAIGKKYPNIVQLLLYSYGIDDNEFVVSYETDDLADFQSLVMELRFTRGRIYTQKDTPIFTCIHKTPDVALNYL